MNAEQPNVQGRSSLLFSLVVMFLAMVWMLVLSQYLLDCSGGFLFSRQDVLFESDASNFLSGMASEKWISPFHTFAIVHPLAAYLWKSIALAESTLLDLFMPRHTARMTAVRIVIASVAATGIGCLALVGIRYGVGIIKIIPLLAIYFLFTANTITSLPDHFGLSSGLLSVHFAILFLRKQTASNLILLAVTGALVVGTTITNFPFPALCLLFALYHARDFKEARFREYRIPLAVALLLVVSICVGLVIERRAGAFMKHFWNNRLVETPLEAGVYALGGILYPAIGPVPDLVVQKDRPFAMLTYEPVRLLKYHPVQAIGAAAWFLLLILSVRAGYRERAARPYVYLLLIWIGFNLIFHNLWGDEFFLFTPHWSWALIALVFIGARHMSLKFVLTVVIPILIAQIYTLAQIGKVLASIQY